MALPLAQRRLIFSLVGVIVLLGMVVGVFVVRGNYLRPTGPLVVEDKPQRKKAAATKTKGSPEQEAVRAWLAENTSSGKWEEVRWHVGKPVDGKTLVRLKYRTANRSGAAELYDYWFTVKDGNAGVTANVTGAPWVD